MTTEVKPNKSTKTFWPYAIVLTFVLFVGYIGQFVYRAMQSSVDLVSTDYYQKELAYQQHINSLSRTALLAEEVQMNYLKEAYLLQVELPQSFQGKPIEGSVQFFRASNGALDFTVPFQPKTDLTQQFSIARLQTGFWKVRLNFNDGKDAYFKELEVNIPVK